LALSLSTAWVYCGSWSLHRCLHSEGGAVLTMIINVTSSQQSLTGGFYEVEMVFDSDTVYMHRSRVGRGDIVPIRWSGNARDKGALARTKSMAIFQVTG
jgi:hypothetical protein